MIHPNTELRHINDTVGYGVFATNFIPEGTIIYVKDSLELEISEDEYNKQPAIMQDVIEKYSYIDEKGNRILSWDTGKYVNHCCNCNTMSTGYGFEIAIRDIQKGEEITDEYGIFNINGELNLECKYDNCRKCVSSSDFDVYYSVWDEKLKKSISKLNSVEQPLFPLVDSASKKELEAYFKDANNYKSVYNLKYKKEVSLNSK